MTSCGETDEYVAAALHGVVFALYVVMSLWHAHSVLIHWRRAADIPFGNDPA